MGWCSPGTRLVEHAKSRQSIGLDKSIGLETMHSTNGDDLFLIDLQLSNPILRSRFRSETKADVGPRKIPHKGGSGGKKEQSRQTSLKRKI